MPTIVQTFNVPLSAAPLSSSLVFNKFDTSLGSLTAITVGLTINAIGELDVFNFSGSAQTFTLGKCSMPCKVTGPDGSNFSSTCIPPTISGAVIAALGITKYPGQTATNSGSMSISSGNYGSYSASGGGTATATAQLLNGTYSGVAAFGVGFNGSWAGSATVTITYTYTGSGAAWSLSISDPVQIIDTKQSMASKMAVSSISIADSIVNSIQKAMLESVSVSVLLSNQLSRKLIENLTIADVRSVMYQRMVTDGISLTDDQSKFLQKHGLERLSITDQQWIFSTAIKVLSKFVSGVEIDGYSVSAFEDVAVTAFVDTYGVSGENNDR